MPGLLNRFRIDNRAELVPHILQNVFSIGIVLHPFPDKAQQAFPIRTDGLYDGVVFFSGHYSCYQCI